LEKASGERGEHISYSPKFEDIKAWQLVGWVERSETQHHRSKEMQYRRAKAKGGTYFFTVVTYDRRRILCAPDNVALLRTVFNPTMPLKMFKIFVKNENLH
jgi:hypothetical protein